MDMITQNPFGKENWKVEPGPDFICLLDYADPARPGELSSMVNAALAAGKSRLWLPDGEYTARAPLSLPSHTYLSAGTRAHILFERGAYTDNAAVHNTEAFRGEPDFYARTNFDEDIRLEGGIWEGGLPAISRSGYHDPSVDGVLFGFTRVRGLSMKKMVIENSVSYHVRLGQVIGFELTDLSFEDALTTYCQDGLHFGGGCEDGYVARIYAAPGGMGDDFFAFNADDVTEETIGCAYGLNYGMLGAPIRRILVEDVCGENVYTAARFLSVRSEISDVTMRRVRIGYRVHGLNLDAGRYCADPFFRDEDFPRGVGCLKNVLLEDWELWNTGSNGPVYSRELFTWETNGELRLRNFRRVRENEPDWLAVPTVRFRHLDELRILADGRERLVPAGTELTLDDDGWDELLVRS